MTGRHEEGVSEVVGEMLMIGLAILLISVFASVLGNFLPAAHDPSLTVLMTNDGEENVTLWHKGGDWVKTDDLTIITGNDTSRKSFIRQDPRIVLVPEKMFWTSGVTLRLLPALPLQLMRQ